ncbi:MAG: NADH-quinone oxidoreductase subunit C [Anaerolineaceae bacterium]|nr:NADH-quinone oxidoreductase subunit C [Anaerolineaceae bacterium]
MNEILLPAVEKLKQQFKAEVSEFRGDVTLLIAPEFNVEVATTLRDEFAFDLLSAVTAVDYYPQIKPRFHMVYIFYSTTNKGYLIVRSPLDGSTPSIRTLETVYPSANWREREVLDLFGVTFEGHSDPRRLLMPPDWVGHPLRKDYPLGYEEVQFTFNIDEIDIKKPKGEL